MDLRFTNREKALTQVGGWLYSRGGGGGEEEREAPKEKEGKEI